MLLVEPAHELDDLGGVLAVEIARGLVRPDDGGVVDERPRDRDALPLAARELVGDVVGRPARPTSPSAASARSRAFCGRRAMSSGLDVLDRAQHGHQVVELEDEPHVQGAVVGALAVGHGREPRSFDQHVPGVDGVEPGEAVQEGRPAAAARAHDRDHLAAADREAHAVQGVHFTVPVS